MSSVHLLRVCVCVGGGGGGGGGIITFISCFMTACQDGTSFGRITLPKCVCVCMFRHFMTAC